MQSKFSYRDARSLEAEFQQVIRQRREVSGVRKDLRHWLRQAGTAVVNFLTGAQSLRIQCKTAGDGAAQWIAYDPTTHTRRVFDSEQAVRAWLEQRYHR